MFKLVRILILLIVLLFVALNAWLTKARSTDWQHSLWVRIYPINADGSAATDRYIAALSTDSFGPIESFIEREVARYGVATDEPLRVDLGPKVFDEPPKVSAQPNVLDVMWWSLKMRWWVGDVTDGLEDVKPDVRIFVRYHQPSTHLTLENSIGVQKGMFGIVNAYATRHQRGRNHVVIAHELLHTIGASDKYEFGSGLPLIPIGLAEPGRDPLFPQRYAEVMGGRIAVTPIEAEMPDSLERVVIGRETALEIRLIK